MAEPLMSPAAALRPRVMPRALPRALPLVLVGAILGISVSGPLSRLADAEPLAIAVWRLTMALTVIGAILLGTGGWREWRGLSRRDLLIAGAGGVLLAIHFWSWIASLALTSVAASVLLVNLHPVVVVIGSALWLGERPTRMQGVGLGLALVGAAVIAVGDAGAPGGAPLLGDALALLGAVTVGLYYLIGRSLRQRLTVWPYVGLVYGSCLMALLVFATVQGTQLWPHAPREWMLFAGIAFGPMLMGHTGFNWLLRYVPAFVVSLAVMAEPVGAALLAWALPGIREVPTLPVVIGGAIVLGGLVVGVLGQRGPASRG